MKKGLVLFAVLVSAVASVRGAAEIGEVIVRQQWPWDPVVKVDYRLSGVTTPVNVIVRAYAGETELDADTLAAAAVGDRLGVSTSGSHSLSFDPRVAFPGVTFDPETFRLELSLENSSALEGEVLYRIIDLSDFAMTDVTRGDFLSGKYGAYETDFSKLDAENGRYWTALENVLIWTGVTNNPAYKTTKLVMRRIPAKGKTFEMGDIPGTYKTRNCDGYAHVTLTNDFWLSVFEVTEAQYKRLTAVNGVPGSCPTSSGDDMPAGKMTYNRLRGKAADWVGFPENKYAVTSGSALQKIRNNMPGCLFDLPTEAQWEYACRAGTTNDLYIGYRINFERGFTNALHKLAWYVSNSGNVVHPGGQLRPNAFGLYDMLGNQWEECRDLVGGAEPAPLEGELTEPYGLDDTTVLYNIERGGRYNMNYAYTVASMRGLNEKSANENGYYGFRLWLKAE